MHCIPFLTRYYLNLCDLREYQFWPNITAGLPPPSPFPSQPYRYLYPECNSNLLFLSLHGPNLVYDIRLIYANSNLFCSVAECVCVCNKTNQNRCPVLVYYRKISPWPFVICTIRDIHILFIRFCIFEKVSVKFRCFAGINLSRLQRCANGDKIQFIFKLKLYEMHQRVIWWICYGWWEVERDF